jgi:hypothetical protein
LYIKQMEGTPLGEASMEEIWRVEFAGWDALSSSQRWCLLAVIGTCHGEWWGAGHAKFPTREYAIEAMNMAVELEMAPRLLVRAA